MLYDNLSVNDAGHLTIAGIDACELAKTYGTPLYVLDEDRVRDRCRTYVEAMKKYLAEGSRPLFASKALSFKGIYPIIASEGMGADVVSAGEIATALAAGFPAGDLFFHGSNKTDAEIAYGVEQGVGCFVVDNVDELETLGREATARGICQQILPDHLGVFYDLGKSPAQLGHDDSRIASGASEGPGRDLPAEVLDGKRFVRISQFPGCAH